MSMPQPAEVISFTRGRSFGQMTNGTPNPRERAWTQVGRFMYHFARVEQKINQAVIKLTELDAKAAPVVELIDFGKKLDDLVRASAYALATNNADKEFAKDVCGRAFDMNKYRRIVAHASFEPAGDGVQFSRAVTTKGEVRPVTDPWTDADFENCYAEMSALEVEFNKLIALLKPTPMSWLLVNVAELMSAYPKAPSVPLGPGALGVPPPPPPDAAG
jgi:hypothetical protein